MAVFRDGYIVAEALSVIPFRLVENLIVRMNSLYAQLFSKVGCDSRDVGQRVALVNDALNVGVGIAAGIDSVDHILDVETSNELNDSFHNYSITSNLSPSP